MSKTTIGLTEICETIMPDGDICGKTLDNCSTHRTYKTNDEDDRKDNDKFEDPLDALVYLVEAVGGEKVREFLAAGGKQL